MAKLLYLTEIKPSRKSSREFASWLEANYPDCSFTEGALPPPDGPDEPRIAHQLVQGPLPHGSR